MSLDFTHRAWYEKYRPGSLQDLQLPDWMMSKFEHYTTHPENTPNLLFVGKPGSGKTTLAEILISKWCSDEKDVMRINGSGVSIDDIRPDNKDSSKGKIYQFASAPPISSKFRIVYMEELQKANAQDFYKYFRQVIELLNTNTIFMISTNSIAELDKPFVQRFQTYTFNSLPKDHVERYIKGVLNHENVQYNSQDVQYVIDYYYPSVREMLQVLQQFTNETTKVLTLDYDLISFNSELIQDLLNIISSGNIASNEFNFKNIQ